jgi:hypothetical protein
MICFENKGNDFAQNYFANSLESRFHAAQKYGSCAKARSIFVHAVIF